MKTLPFTVLFAAFATTIALSLAIALADDAVKPAAPKSDVKKDSAEDVEKKLKDKIDAAAKAQAEGQPAPKTVEPKPDGPRLPAPTPGRIDQPDPKIIGIAPGSAAPRLKREGEFVLSRRGRLVRSEGGQFLFAFDADTDKAGEAPMILMPCRLLQNMEEMTQEHGERTVFILSGQVFVYRGANHLLPTMMKPSIDKGNLQK
jgi:hypothetical protein